MKTMININHMVPSPWQQCHLGKKPCRTTRSKVLSIWFHWPKRIKSPELPVAQRSIIVTSQQEEYYVKICKECLVGSTEFHAFPCLVSFKVFQRHSKCLLLVSPQLVYKAAQQQCLHAWLDSPQMVNRSTWVDDRSATISTTPHIILLLL